MRAAAFAEYLSEKVCKAPSGLRDISVEPPPPTDCGSSFSMGELDIVLRSLRTGRSPGPDGIVSELRTGSPYILKLFLLDHFNHCLATSTTPDTWDVSAVVMIVKKIQGDTRDLSNYRPISLTNTMYKIFASLFEKRLSSYFDDKIRPTQFGPRANRSTSQPIHIMQHALHLLFWIGLKLSTLLPSNPLKLHLSNLVFLLYFRRPFFLSILIPNFVSEILDTLLLPTHGQEDSDRVVHFPLIFSVWFLRSLRIYSTMWRLLITINLVSWPEFLIPLSHFGTWNMQMTPLLSNSAVQLTKLLHLLQHQGAIRGLYLNLSKCAHLKLHSTERISFSPNCQSPCDCITCRGLLNPIEYVPESDEVKYLGVYSDSLSSNNKNISYRISQAYLDISLFLPPGNSLSIAQ